MESLEIAAKTVEEATKKALIRLNVSLDEVEIKVINQGKGGILGIGAEDARILVTVKPAPGNTLPDESGDAKTVIGELLENMGVSAQIEVKMPQEALDEEGESNPVVFNLTGGNLEILIGRRGQTLDALQYLVRLILTRQSKSKLPIMIDVDGYKQKRFDDLRAMALNVAEQVKARNSSIRLEPMTAFERRIVHMALAKDPEVTTESIGEGDYRKVVVYPKNSK
jgi:spoIIIJ-associated protein